MDKQKRSARIGRYLWAHSKRYVWAIVLLVLLQVIRATLSVGFALGTKKLIDYATLPNPIAFRRAMWELGLIAIGLVLSYVLVTYLRDWSMDRLDWHWKADLRGVLFRSEYQAVSGFHTGEITNRLNSDVGVINGVLVNLTPNLVMLLVRLVVAAIALAQLEIGFALVIVVCGAGMLGVAALVRERLKQMNHEISLATGKVSGFLQETLGKLLMIQALDVSAEVERRSDVLMRDRWNKQKLRRNYNVAGNFMLVAGCYVAEVVATIYCGAKLLIGTMSFGTYTAVVQLVGLMEGPLMNISGVIPQYYRMITAVERLQELEALPREPDYILPPEVLYRDMRELCVENLSFSYEERTEVLRGASLVVPKQSFAVITGESGSGKSTLLKILLGLLRPGEGECYVKGEYRQTPIDRATRALFAYVPPGSMLLSGTIRENLLLTRPDASEKELAEAIFASCLEEVIASLPDGLDTVMGENAVGLSEGQAQRVNIARAVLSQAPVMLLDEATSALDLETEQRVLERLHAIKEKTCIAVTHRLSALQFADMHIHVTQNGEVEIRPIDRETRVL